MKGFLRILAYLLTWQSINSGAIVFGAVMLVLALNTLLLSPYLAFSFSLLAFMGLLMVPCLSSAPALRGLISSRNLSIIPWFGFKAGLALLLLTLLTAAFLPLAGWATARPGMTLWFGPKIFIIASLYMGVMQVIMPSRHFVPVISLIPIAIMLLLRFFGLSLLTLAANNTVVAATTLLTLLGWAYALWVLARQSSFKPVFKSSDTGFSQHNAIQSAGKFLGVNLGRKISGAATLLFAYPASLPARLINVGSWIVVYPLINTVMMRFMMPRTGDAPLLPALPIYLAASLLLGCISFIQVGEMGARARLLWLRLPGGRMQVWRKLERELWTNIAVLAGVLLLNVAAVLLINPEQYYLPHYVLVILACAAYDSYRTLCSRLYQWSSLVQALVMIASLCSMIAAVGYSVTHDEFSALFLLEAGLLLLALLFRTLARWQFNSVDWLVLKHEISKRAAATA